MADTDEDSGSWFSGVSSLLHDVNDVAGTVEKVGSVFGGHHADYDPNLNTPVAAQGHAGQVKTTADASVWPSWVWIAIATGTGLLIYMLIRRKG